ncbi:MAG: hypothetical protein ABWY04_10485, partial [Arthrobacter sp.]
KLRHTTGWKPTPASKTEPPGWTSPTGRHYTSEHQDWEPPHWPEQAVPEDIRAVDDLMEPCPPPDDPTLQSLDPVSPGRGTNGGRTFPRALGQLDSSAR